MAISHGSGGAKVCIDPGLIGSGRVAGVPVQIDCAVVLAVGCVVAVRIDFGPRNAVSAEPWAANGHVNPAGLAVFQGHLWAATMNGLMSRVQSGGDGAWRLGLVGLQAAIAAWLAGAGGAGTLEWSYQKFLDPAPFSAGRIPQLGMALIALGVLAAAASALVTRSAVAAALAGAIIAFAIAAHVPNATITFAIFSAMAGVMVRASFV